MAKDDSFSTLSGILSQALDYPEGGPKNSQIKAVLDQLFENRYHGRSRPKDTFRDAYGLKDDIRRKRSWRLPPTLTSVGWGVAGRGEAAGAGSRGPAAGPPRPRWGSPRGAFARCFRPSSMRRVMRNPAGSITYVASRAQALRAHAAARHELCSILVDRVETKLPDPIKAAQVPHVQHERAIGLDGCHRPAWASTRRDLVTDVKMGEGSDGEKKKEAQRTSSPRGYHWRRQVFGPGLERPLSLIRRMRGVHRPP